MHDHLDPRPVDLPIVLIAPMCAGKSTIARLLADALDVERCEMDARRWTYYDEIGYDAEAAERVAESDEGMRGLLRYWKPFEAHAVERIVSECPRGVIDFGAGHSVYADEGLLARVQQALSPLRNVVLLLPSEDPEASTRILNRRFVELLERKGVPVDDALLEVNESFVRHPSNRLLATITVYTRENPPEETCREIVRRLR